MRRTPAGADGRLTVCHVFSGDLWAGAEVVIANLLSYLKEDPDVRVLALSLNEGVLTERLRAAGITTHVIPEARHSVVGILRRAARLLSDQRVDIIHSHRYKENLLAWLLAKRLGVTDLVSTVHGVSEASSRRGLGSWIGRARRRLDYFVLKRSFSCSVAVSEEMKRVLVGGYGFRENSIEVIRNGGGFPARECSKPAPGECFHIGTVGRMVPVKGFELFLEVAAAVRRESRSVRFSILGDGPLREELARRAATLHIADCVEFVPPTPDPFSYYHSLDLYLNTSLHEGLPLSVVEAMACGKPVVSAAVGGIPEIVVDGEHGFLVEGRELRRFAECCLRLMRDGDLRTAMGERAAATARSRLSAQAMAVAYGRLYKKCAARMGGRARVADRGETVSLPGTPGTDR